MFTNINARSVGAAEAGSSRTNYAVIFFKDENMALFSALNGQF